jgi:hypothetical protein
VDMWKPRLEPYQSGDWLRPRFRKVGNARKHKRENECGLPTEVPGLPQSAQPLSGNLCGKILAAVESAVRALIDRDFA